MFKDGPWYTYNKNFFLKEPKSTLIQSAHKHPSAKGYLQNSSQGAKYWGLFHTHNSPTKPDSILRPSVD